MSEEAIKYVQHQLNLAKSRLQGHITGPSGKLYPKRYIYIKLEKYVQDFITAQSHQRWLLLPGLRGIGKTTVFSQLFLQLLQKIEPLRVLYISLDEAELLNLNLLDILSAYEQILGEPFEKLSQPIFLFIDEVQYDAKWGLALKSLYDRTKKAFICCTGSSSVALQTNADVRRRVVLERLYPLSFSEYQILLNGVYPQKGLKAQIREALYFSNNGSDAYKKLQKLQSPVLQYWSQVHPLEIQNYLTRGTLPFALEIKNQATLFAGINDLLDKIILKDIQSLRSFDQQTLHSIKKLLVVLAGSNDTLSISKLPGLTGLASKITVQNVLDVLEQAELLIRVPPYGSSTTKVTKPSKYLFMSPAIRMALLGITGKNSTFNVNLGKFLEDIVSMHLKREFVTPGIGHITYDPREGGADFVVQIANERQLVIEVGLGKKNNKQAVQTLERVSGDYGIIICDTELKYLEEENIIRLPTHFFLMM